MEHTDNQARKVCIYCEKWTRGGIETFLTETLKHMDRRNLKFHLAVASWQSDAFREELADMGVQVHILQGRKEAGAFGRTIGSLKPFWELLRKERFDVVHLNIFHGAALSLAFLARRAGTPAVIAHSHGAGLRRSRSARLKKIVHYICCLLFAETPTVRWAASAAAGKFLFPAAKDVKLIPNGVDTGRFLFSSGQREAVRRELGLMDAYVIGCVGRLENQKNQVFLLDVLAECVKVRPNTVLLLVGDGEDRGDLKQKVAELNVAQHVRFLGVSAHVPELMCAMDVLAVPSLSEGLGIAAIEGQASGLPVVCSTGVPEEVRITDAVSFLALQKGPEQWAEALLSCRPLDRLGQNERVKNSRFQIDISAAVVRKGYEGDERR